MFNKVTLSERLKIARAVYQVNLRDIEMLSDSLSIDSKNGGKQTSCKISKSTMSQWESNSRVPVLSAIQTIADIFGVSLDWLSGRSEQPFNESTLESIEKNILPLTIIKDGRSLQVSSDTAIKMPAEYIDSKLRKIYYSPAERANIIFLLISLKSYILNTPNVLLYDETYKKYSINYAEIDPKITTFLYHLLFNSPRIGIAPNLLSNIPYGKPIYDLEAACKKQL